jgi:predicted transcriptional regulator
MMLTEGNLLSYDSLTQRYKTTEKGMRLLQFFNELDPMMKKASQRISILIPPLSSGKLI